MLGSTQLLQSLLNTLAQTCAGALDQALDYTFSMVMLVLEFFDGVVGESERAFKDLQVMVHLVQNKNIN